MLVYIIYQTINIVNYLLNKIYEFFVTSLSIRLTLLSK